MMAFIIAFIVVAAIVPFAFRGTNPAALFGDIILLILLVCILNSCN